MYEGRTTLEVEVAYAAVNGKTLAKVTVEEGSNIFDAILKSKILHKYPEINVKENKIGVFGKIVKSPKEHILRPGDRVEIYRSLIKSKESSKN